MNHNKTLKEYPDTVRDGDKNYEWDDPHAAIFGLSGDDVYTNISDDVVAIHGMMARDFGIGETRSDFDYPGRVWFNPKIISFWTYPNKNKFLEIISELEKQLNVNIFNNNWRVEVYEEGGSNILIPIEEYTGEYYEPSEEIKNIEHVLSPMDKNKKRPQYDKLPIEPARWKFYKEKNVAENIIKEEINKFLTNENLQLADKI
jgi:hypothetical protein